MPGCLPWAPERVELPSAEIGKVGEGKAGGGGVRFEVWLWLVIGHLHGLSRGPLDVRVWSLGERCPLKT